MASFSSPTSSKHTAAQALPAEVASDLSCPICLLPLDDAVRLRTCGHRFCRSCLLSVKPTRPEDRSNASQTSTAAAHKEEAEVLRCPMCRGQFSFEDDVKSDEVAKSQLQTQGVACEGCSDIIPASSMRAHHEKCTQYAEWQAKQVRDATRAEPDAGSKNRSTFACPVSGCKESNMTSRDLIKHANASHAGGRRVSCVCPVCAAMPWGDASYLCNDWVGHLNLRHQMEYDEYCDFGAYEGAQDEDELLAAVLAASLNDA